MNNMNFTPFPILTTERLVLRQITIEDLDEFYILKSDERLLKGYDAKPKTCEKARQKLIRDNEGIARNEWIIWGITLKNENKLIGSICFWNISEEQPKAEIGYELMVEWQGKGIMQEAVQAVIEYGFMFMKLKFIEAVPNPNNASSVKLLERNSFIRGDKFFETDPSDGRLLERVTFILENKTK
ncbi:MAG: GNAT family N-acetyltransferase [Caulobacteraceae bacterium]